MPEEYSFSGWYKWTTIPDEQQWHNTFRVSVHRDNTVSDYTRLGDRDLAVWVGKDPANYHFATYSYTDVYGNGEPNYHIDQPYGS